MGWEKWRENGKRFFHILTTTLFTLLLPLSFLLLSRLLVANYLLSLSPFSQTDPYSIPIFLLFQIIPTILNALVSLISSLTLLHALTGQTTLVGLSSKPVFPIYISWFLLCTFQICVGLGLEGSITIGTIDDISLGQETSLMSRVVFFLGLHETMRYWWRTVVKPVVDDTVLGFRKEESWPEKGAAAAALGGVWWWSLRAEVETLVIMAQVKKKLILGVGVADVIAWWLYYLTVTIGLVKFAKLVMWFAVILLFTRVESNPGDESSRDNDEKV